jgi:hypothetical protein
MASMTESTKQSITTNMHNPFDELTQEDNESFYNHLMSIWEITPDKVKERFRSNQQCLLCDECKGYVSSVQKAIIEAKKLKYGQTTNLDN